MSDYEMDMMDPANPVQKRKLGCMFIASGEECDKKYWLCQEFSVTHRTKPDCELNGAEHVCWPSQSGWAVKFCKVCDHCRVGRK